MASLPDLHHMHLAIEAGQMSISPKTSALFPADAHAALTSSDMQHSHAHELTDRPALAFLDITSNCSRNSAALAAAAANIPTGDKVKYMSAIVGAPGIAGLYLPQDVCAPLQELATKAATAAFYRNILGNQFIRMRLTTDYRPLTLPDWHCDALPNIMLCADKIGTMFMLTGGQMQDHELRTSSDAEMIQALPGMPVSFNKIVHSAPYLNEPECAKNFGVSSTVIFECFGERDDVSQECVSSSHIASVIRSMTGKDPKPMSYRLLT